MPWVTLSDGTQVQVICGKRGRGKITARDIEAIEEIRDLLRKAKGENDAETITDAPPGEDR